MLSAKLRQAAFVSSLLPTLLAASLPFSSHFGQGQQTAAQPAPPANAKPLAYFTDIAAKAGLTMQNVFGGVTTKKYIIETTGTGVAIFDYDGDGWPDIFIVNGTKLEGSPAGQQRRPIIFIATITTAPSPTSPRKPGWRTPDGDKACASAITTTTGTPDLYVTYYGKNVLYHNNGNGTLHRCQRKSRRGRRRQSLGHRLRLRRLRSRRPSRPHGRELRRFRFIDRARSRRSRHVSLERCAGDVRPARIARREKYPVPQSRRRHV